jgi:hypothetical protein
LILLAPAFGVTELSAVVFDDPGAGALGGVVEHLVDDLAALRRRCRVELLIDHPEDPREARPESLRYPSGFIGNDRRPSAWCGAAKATLDEARARTAAR